VPVVFVEEGLIDRREAVQRIDPAALEQLLHPTIDPGIAVTVVATGLAASPGAASGSAIFDADLAAERAKEGEHVILVRPGPTLRRHRAAVRGPRPRGIAAPAKVGRLKRSA